MQLIYTMPLSERDVLGKIVFYNNLLKLFLGLEDMGSISVTVTLAVLLYIIPGPSFKDLKVASMIIPSLLLSSLSIL